MHRTMLAWSALVAVCIAAGCKTEMKDSSGNPVVDRSGNTVMVSGSTQERIEKVAPAIRAGIRTEIEAIVKNDGVSAAASAGIPEEKLKSLAGPDATPEDIEALKTLVGAEADKYLKETVYPETVAATKKAMESAVDKYIAASQFKQATAVVSNVKKTGIAEIDGPVLACAEELNKTKIVKAYSDSIIAKVDPYVDKCISSGKYDKAREALWRSATTGNSDVDAAVRTRAIERMHTVVNPAEWTLIETELKDKVASLAAENEYDAAIDWLKAYRRVRTYSFILDEKLDAVKDELVKIGIADENVQPILEATGKLVGEAARILDMTDVTTNSVTTIAGAETSGFEPDIEAYKAKLEEYRKMLVRYDCTEANADAIAGKFDRDVAPLIASLSRPGTKENDTVETKAFLQLGTGALNARIDKLVAALIADIEQKKAAYLKAMREAQIQAAIDDLVAKVKQLVADGEYAQAREAVWEATSTEDVELNAKVRETGIELLLTLVNPSNWNAIEKEFADKVAEAAESAAYDEAIEWVEQYPCIRTYTSVIDAKLDSVKDELVKLGVAADKVDPVAEETCRATVEAERLASHVDTLRTLPAGEKVAVPLDDYEKLLAGYRKALVLNDCTEANADALASGFDAKVRPLINLLSATEEKTVLLLGSNAVNDRLAALRAKTVEVLKSAKYKHVFTDLIAKVSAAVEESRFGDARNIIRDVGLVGDADWDARIYATRVGLLNSIVNPAQFASLAAEIDAKKEELFSEKRYEEFCEYAENYEYVHDTYEQIAQALEQIKVAMVGLTIAGEDAAVYIDSLSARIREAMEKRTGVYKVDADKDLTELEKALSELEKGIVAQYCRPDEVKQFCEVVKAEILALISKTPDPMTTWEMNEALAARLRGYAEATAALVVERDAENAAAAYARLLEEIDAEVSFDSQIAMAEDAIAKQLGIKCPDAHLKVNALLGEYARTMRLLKLGKALDAGQKTVMLLGGAYLDQPAVIDRALELGADINGTSSRDPLARTAVLVAIQQGHNSLLKHLASANAALGVSDANGDTALHYAVTRGNLAVVKAMLAKNDVNAANKAGETALFIAARKNQAALVEALIAAKADVNAVNAAKASVMDAACLAGSRDVLDALDAAGAAYGPAQLAIAAAKDHIAVAQWLVGKGVDVNAPGVMQAAVCKSATKRYLVHEGGLPVPCGEGCACAVTAGCCGDNCKCAAAAGSCGGKVSEK